MAPRLSDHRWAHSKLLENVKQNLERASEEATRRPASPKMTTDTTAQNDHRYDSQIKTLRATASI